EHVEADHVDEDVPESGVKELAGDDAPELVMEKGGVNVEVAVELDGIGVGGGDGSGVDTTAEDVVLVDGNDEGFDDEDGDVEDDQPGGDRPHADLTQAAGLGSAVVVAVVDAHLLKHAEA